VFLTPAWALQCTLRGNHLGKSAQTKKSKKGTRSTEEINNSEVVANEENWVDTGKGGSDKRTCAVRYGRPKKTPTQAEQTRAPGQHMQKNAKDGRLERKVGNKKWGGGWKSMLSWPITGLETPEEKHGRFGAGWMVSFRS